MVQIFPAIMDVFSELDHNEFNLVIATRPIYSSQFHYDYTVFPGQEIFYISITGIDMHRSWF